MEHVFAQRLINARKIRGLSQRELCSLLDGQISTNAIAKYETGKMLPSSQNLIAMAKVLDFDLDYFFRPFTVTIDPNSFEFRKRSSLTAKKEASIRENIALSIEKLKISLMRVPGLACHTMMCRCVLTMTREQLGCDSVRI